MIFFDSVYSEVLKNSAPEFNMSNKTTTTVNNFMYAEKKKSSEPNPTFVGYKKFPTS
jgi:hypothetical protein